MRARKPESFRLGPHDWVPNHPSLPILLYRRVLHGEAGNAMASALEALFRGNDWAPRWRDGIYDFHHYHSTAHELLGVASGEATLMLGGPGGRTMCLTRGDVLLLPAGTGHCSLRASADFLVVGAYPPDQSWDICRHAPSQAMLARIGSLPFPERDPVAGSRGPMVSLWRRTPAFRPAPITARWVDFSRDATA